MVKKATSTLVVAFVVLHDLSSVVYGQSCVHKRTLSSCTQLGCYWCSVDGYVDLCLPEEDAVGATESSIAGFTCTAPAAGAGTSGLTVAGASGGTVKYGNSDETVVARNPSNPSQTVAASSTSSSGNNRRGGFKKTVYEGGSLDIRSCFGYTQQGTCCVREDDWSSVRFCDRSAVTGACGSGEISCPSGQLNGTCWVLLSPRECACAQEGTVCVIVFGLTNFPSPLDLSNRMQRQHVLHQLRCDLCSHDYKPRIRKFGIY